MKLYTAKALAEIMDVSVDTIWRWGRQGKLKRIKVGRIVRFEMPKSKERIWTEE